MRIDAPSKSTANGARYARSAPCFPARAQAFRKQNGSRGLDDGKGAEVRAPWVPEALRYTNVL